MSIFRKFIVGVLFLFFSFSILFFHESLIAYAQEVVTYEHASELAVIGDYQIPTYGNVLFHWLGNPFSVSGGPLGSEAYLDTTVSPYRLRGWVWTDGVGWWALDLDSVSDPSDIVKVELEPIDDPDPEKATQFNVTGSGWGINFGWLDFTGSVTYERYGDYTSSGIGITGKGVFSGAAWNNDTGWFSMDEVHLDLSPYDRSEISISETVFAADSAKSVNVTTTDSGLDVATNGVNVTVERYYRYDFFGDYIHDEYIKSYVSPSPGAQFIHDFSLVEPYDITGTRTYSGAIVVTDRSGNKTTIQNSEMFWVVANVPKFGAGASTIDMSSGPKVAVKNAAGTYNFITHLEDEYGNVIRGAYKDGSPVKEVIVNLTFNNTVNTDQFSQVIQGDAVTYNSNDYLIDNQNAAIFGNSIDLDGIYDLLATGDYSLNINSIAPTGGAHFPPGDPATQLTVASCTLDISTPIVGADVGQGAGSISLTLPSTELAYWPALDNQLIWPGGDDSLKEGVETSYDTLLQTANLGSFTVSNIEQETIFAPDEPIFEFLIRDLDYDSLTDFPGIDLFSVLSFGKWHYAQLDSQLPPTVNPALYEQKNPYLESFVSLSTYPRLQYVTPTSLLGTGSTISLTNVDISTRLAYVNNSETVYSNTIAHPGYTIADISVSPVTIKIEGKVRSDYIGQVGSDVLKNIGDIKFDKVRSQMRKNVTQLVKGSSINSGGTPTGWDPFSVNALRGGEVLYFKGDTIWGGAGDITIPAGRHTLVVLDGDLTITENIKYADPNSSSLGVVVMASKSGKLYNMYVHPNVTSLVGAYYIEGSFLSLCEGVGSDCQSYKFYNGFNTAAGELLNNIVVKGSVLSYNTIGGSKLNPPQLPDLVSLPAEFVGSGDTAKKKQQQFAIGYDLLYLRRGTGSGTPVTILYDPRIQTITPLGFESEEAGSVEQVVR